MELVDEVAARRALPSPDARRFIRVTAGVSLRRMGEALDVQASTVMRWERGQAVPRPDALTRYAALLEQLQRQVAS